MRCRKMVLEATGLQFVSRVLNSNSESTFSGSSACKF